MKNFFYFKHSHRNGILFLSLIILIIFIAKNAYQKQKNQVFDFSLYKTEIDQLRLQTNKESVTTFSEKPTIKTIEQYQPVAKKISPIVEINSADTLEFESLPAIGQVYSKRICKYRNLLGGFYSINQLMEVYGMDSVRFTKILPHLIIDTTKIKTININTCTKNELQSHPYISYKLAGVIINYKQQNGVYVTLRDLTKIHLIDSLKFRKIVPYLTIDENKSAS